LVKNSHKIIQLIFFIVLSLQFLFAELEPIALCLDVNGAVLRKGGMRKGLIRRGDYIYHGDKIITGDIGSASFIMIYEDTSIRIYNNSVIRLISEKHSLLRHSELALFGGKVIVEADDNHGYSFVVNTPSTTATVSGTNFLAQYQEDRLFEGIDYSIFTVLNGVIELENLQSNHFMYIFRGETIVSTANGDFLRLDTFREPQAIVNTLMDFR
tara:strand:- start:4736 stop:5371 length:636 start_codon:yes stop_codon:yes gene_type:complete